MKIEQITLYISWDLSIAFCWLNKFLQVQDSQIKFDI